jgi:hypothetical protein
MMLPDLLTPRTKSSIAGAIRAFHYGLWPYDVLNATPEALEAWIEQVSLPSEWGYGDSPLDAVGAADTWNWRERQAKWLVNSLRGVEEIGLSWWMPLWDDEFTRFWMGVPIDYLRGRRLYQRFVQDKFSAATGEAIPNYEHAVKRGSRLKAKIRERVPESVMPMLRKTRQRVSPPSPGFGEMGWETWVKPIHLKAFSSKGANITSFAALETLLELESTLPGLLPLSLHSKNQG